MEKDNLLKETFEIKNAELLKESALLKEAAEIKMAMEDGRLVDIEGLDVKKIVNTLNDIKKQNAYLFDAIKHLEQHDKHFESKKNTLFGIANNLRYTTENQLRQLSDFLFRVKDNIMDAKYMKTIASVNKPNKESIKYGQTFINLRKSFLNMAVKRASEKSKENDSGGTQS